MERLVPMLYSMTPATAVPVSGASRGRSADIMSELEERERIWQVRSDSSVHHFRTEQAIFSTRFIHVERCPPRREFLDSLGKRCSSVHSIKQSGFYVCKYRLRSSGDATSILTFCFPSDFPLNQVFCYEVKYSVKKDVTGNQKKRDQEEKREREIQ